METAWGAPVSEKEPLQVDLDDCVLNLSNAALAAGTTADKPTVLQVQCPGWDDPIAVCSLGPLGVGPMHASLSTSFHDLNQQVNFTVEGPGVIHMIGDLVDFSNDSRSDSDSDDSDAAGAQAAFEAAEGDGDNSEEEDDDSSDSDIAVPDEVFVAMETSSDDEEFVPEEGDDDGDEPTPGDVLEWAAAAPSSDDEDEEMGGDNDDDDESADSDSAEALVFGNADEVAAINRKSRGLTADEAAEARALARAAAQEAVALSAKATVRAVKAERKREKKKAAAAKKSAAKAKAEPEPKAAAAPAKAKAEPKSAKKGKKKDHETGRKRKRSTSGGDEDAEEASAGAGAGSGAGAGAAAAEGEPETKKLTKKQKRKLKKQRKAEAAAAAAKPDKAVAPAKVKVVAHKSGLKWIDHEVGIGKKATSGRKVTIKYTGRLAKNDKQFDSGSISFRLGGGEVIRGMDLGVANGMRVGGSRRLLIPAKLGYGKRGAGRDIPPNSNLVFDIELVRA